MIHTCCAYMSAGTELGSKQVWVSFISHQDLKKIAEKEMDEGSEKKELVTHKVFVDL